MIVCYNPSTGNPSVFHNVNNGYSSSYLVSTNIAIGITNATVQVVNGNLTCSFVRDNTLTVPGFYKISDNTPAFIVLAYGTGNNFKLLKKFNAKFCIIMEKRRSRCHKKANDNF